MNRATFSTFFLTLTLLFVVPSMAQMQNPFESGRLNYKLPDRDNDSIPDADDRCPDEWGYREYEGCRERQPEPGFIRFDVQPSDVNISIVQKHLTGDTVISIMEGRYSCSFAASGYVDTALSISVAPAETLIIVMELREELPEEHSGKVLITSNVYGADVTMRWEWVTGKTPFRLEMPEGTYYVTLSHAGYADTTVKVAITSGEETSEYVYMAKMQPTSYPSTKNHQNYSSSYQDNTSRRTAHSARTRTSIVGEYVIDDPIAFAIDPIALLLKFPLNKEFKDFKDGFSGGFFLPDNYRSLTYANSYSLSFFNLHINLELGQWANWAGEKSNREPIIDTAYVLDNADDEAYQITEAIFIGDEMYAFVSDTSDLGFYSTKFRIKSTALSVGLSLPLGFVRMAYAVGFQWEDLIINNALKFNDSGYEFVDIVFNNDFAFHHFRFEVLPIGLGKGVGVGLYCDYRQSFGSIQRTGWGILRLGTTIRFGDYNDARDYL